ncbi:hypothetical protein OG884_15545 [Streptosporangium sp. NBC_01755]|uniref:hypothetical protein n=1 Tax=Streptosporangium sp. NBC_01755 TaxID=2975949 RepID=UPI002DD86FFA|nr:hypothetical protein [Streptosporangium sp. NBC_01755]WSD03248.1 hypothetical protein OG884_15545 [Streptosporangium sp. NBC_01755]
MEALGRLFNAIPIADNVYVPLRDVGGVAFLCYLAGAAGDTYTLTEARDAGGTGAQVLATITRYHTSNGVGGAWTLHTQAAGSTVVTAAATAENGMLVEVEDTELSDRYTHVKLASTGAGLVTALQRDLQVQRAPASLAALV